MYYIIIGIIFACIVKIIYVKETIYDKTINCPRVLINEWKDFRKNISENIKSTIIVLYKIHERPIILHNLYKCLEKSKLKTFNPKYEYEIDSIYLCCIGKDLLKGMVLKIDDQIDFLRFIDKFNVHLKKNPDAIEELKQNDRILLKLDFVEKFFWEKIVLEYRKKI